MVRLPRFFVEDQPQHIIQRGNNRQAIFAAEHDYHFYLDCLSRASDDFGLTIHAYVLMTNHVHLLATPLFPYSIAKTMQSLGRRYVQYFNYTYQRTGTLWEGRYKATLIDSEHYLLTCMKYIELNPVRAMMTENPQSYPWSSYPANAIGHANPLITAHSVYLKLATSHDKRQQAYRLLFNSELDQSVIDDIREKTNKAWVLGNDTFCKQIQALTQRRVAPLPCGRPKTVK